MAIRYKDTIFGNLCIVYFNDITAYYGVYKC